jgi:hypothetical protein
MPQPDHRARAAIDRSLDVAIADLLTKRWLRAHWAGS